MIINLERSYSIDELKNLLKDFNCLFCGQKCISEEYFITDNKESCWHWQCSNSKCMKRSDSKYKNSVTINFQSFAPPNNNWYKFMFFRAGDHDIYNYGDSLISKLSISDNKLDIIKTYRILRNFEKYKLLF